MTSDRRNNPEFEALLRAYLEICNHSLGQIQTPEVKAILEAALSAGQGQQVEFLLRDDRPQAKLGIEVGEQGLSESSDKESVELPQAQKWVFDYSYLKSVVEQKELYVKEPERLDWSWLYMLAKSN